jgi:hypothetical protein
MKKLNKFIASELPQSAYTIDGMSAASSYQKAMEALASGDAVRKAMGAASSYQKTMEALASGDAVRKAMGTASSYQKTMEALASGDAIQRAMSAATLYQQPIAEIMSKSSFRNAIDALVVPSNLLATLDFIAHADKHILAGELSKTGLVNETLESQLQEIGETEDVDSFVKAFSKLSPVIQSILVYILLYLLLPVAQNIIANLVTPHVEKLISDPVITEREKVKQLKAFNFDELGISNLRFVTIEHLLLRESPSTKSKIMDELRFGQVVTMLNKQRNWMEISYAYEDGKIMRGWVFSRYTAKFQK